LPGRSEGKVVTQDRAKRLLDVLNRRQPDLQVILEKLKNPHNISAILRSCDAVGIQYVHIIEESGAVCVSREVSRGSAQWLDISFYHDMYTCARGLLIQDFKIYVTAIKSGAKDFREVNYTVPCAIVVGSELEGVSQTALKVAHQSIVTPMMGFVQSFNVSVATAIILYEAFCQREKAGMYRESRLDTKEKERFLNRWLAL
jgi:tRNA (guanosine-2'-O-)-methyltransferase